MSCNDLADEADVGDAILMVAKKCGPSLRTLILDDNELGDAVAGQLAAAVTSSLSGLKTLSLKSNSITAKGSQKLLQAAQDHSLDIVLDMNPCGAVRKVEPKAPLVSLPPGTPCVDESVLALGLSREPQPDKALDLVVSVLKRGGGDAQHRRWRVLSTEENGNVSAGCLWRFTATVVFEERPLSLLVPWTHDVNPSTMQRTLTDARKHKFMLAQQTTYPQYTVQFSLVRGPPPNAHVADAHEKYLPSYRSTLIVSRRLQCRPVAGCRLVKFDVVDLLQQHAQHLALVAELAHALSWKGAKTDMELAAPLPFFDVSGAMLRPQDWLLALVEQKLLLPGEADL